MGNKKILRKFEEIYNATYKNILKYIVCKCRNIDDVNDILQETYLELYTVLEGKADIKDYESYTFIIAKNKMIKHFNSNKKIENISIYQENNEEEYVIDIDSRN